jgi:hypothetical protein
VDKRGLNKHGLRGWIGFVRPRWGSLVNMVKAFGLQKRPAFQGPSLWSHGIFHYNFHLDLGWRCVVSLLRKNYGVGFSIICFFLLKFALRFEVYFPLNDSLEAENKYHVPGTLTPWRIY